MEVETVCQRVKHALTLSTSAGPGLFSQLLLLSCTFFLLGAKRSLLGCFSGWKWTGFYLTPNLPVLLSFQTVNSPAIQSAIT